MGWGGMGWDRVNTLVYPLGPFWREDAVNSRQAFQAVIRRCYRGNGSVYRDTIYKASGSRGPRCVASLSAKRMASITLRLYLPISKPFTLGTKTGCDAVPPRNVQSKEVLPPPDILFRFSFFGYR